MDKPRFIRALLQEAGTAIDPIALVRRIPEGLEVEGLRDAIGRMVREFEMQGSVSEGVARVLRSEVISGQTRLREGRRRGVLFEVVREDVPVEKVEVSVDAEVSMVDPEGKKEEEEEAVPGKRISPEDEVKAGHCVGCSKLFVEDGESNLLECRPVHLLTYSTTEKETLIGFACGHVYHLSCLLRERSQDEEPNAAIAVAEHLQSQLARDVDSEEGGFTRSVGAKTAHAKIISSAIGTGGCPRCHMAGGDDDDGYG
jgi:vacuolar protein sorting-associated protein 41